MLNRPLVTKIQEVDHSPSGDKNTVQAVDHSRHLFAAIITTAKITLIPGICLTDRIRADGLRLFPDPLQGRVET
jgi:hypothetical protein